MAGSLDGKRALVTGASSGIGEATAEALAAAGALVALGARRKERIDKLAERIEKGGGVARAFEVDVSDEGAARGFVEGATAALGGLDILVNNAGVMLLGPVDGADTEGWRRMVGVNVLGLLYCTHAALPIMRQAGGGHIVNVSSVAGRSANAGSAVYNATKFGVTAFSEALRQEALDANIRVTVVEPGYVATELQCQNVDPTVQARLEKMQEEIGDVLESEDIANSILYAVSQPQRASVNEILVRPTRQRR